MRNLQCIRCIMRSARRQPLTFGTLHRVHQMIPLDRSMTGTALGDHTSWCSLRDFLASSRHRSEACSFVTLRTMLADSESNGPEAAHATLRRATRQMSWRIRPEQHGLEVPLPNERPARDMLKIPSTCH